MGNVWKYSDIEKDVKIESLLVEQIAQMASELPDSYRIDFVIALSKALVTFEQPIESSVKSRVILAEIIAALLD